jgi:hypothetical protein
MFNLFSFSDEAQSKRDGVEKTSDDQRSSVISSNPECRPARPDPVDMDDDELEMLSEGKIK